MSDVRVKKTEYLASLDYERVLVEFLKDGNSPQCPNSWTWGMWFDGDYIDGTCEEGSLHATVKDAIERIDGIVEELMAMNDYLKAYEVFGRDSEVDE